MARALLLALDCGTTGVRALVVDASGAVRGRAYRPLATRFPAPGRVEQDPEVLWTSSLGVLRAALAAARARAQEVAGLGIATQRATILAWDAKSGAPLAPALGWQDQRAADVVARLRARGLPLTTQPSVGKILWWLESEPAVRDAARAGTLRLGTPEAWLGWRLSGGALHATEPGQAACTALYDPNAGDWADPLLARLGIDRAWLPRVADSAAVLGEASGALLGAPVPLAARAGDQQAAAFAAGVVREGRAKLTLGTAAMADLHTGPKPAAPRPGTFPLPLWRVAGEASFCLEGHVATAGAAVDWLVDLGLARDAAGVLDLAASASGDGGVVAVPALQGLGTPHLADAARGLVGGLTRGTSAAELARALVTGVAQRCVDVWETLAPADPTLRVDGGLTRSDLLLQLLADLSGCEVERAAEAEGTALGVAGLAARAVGVACAAPGAEGRARFAPALDAGERAARRERWRRVVRERVLP